MSGIIPAPPECYKCGGETKWLDLDRLNTICGQSGCAYIDERTEKIPVRCDSCKITQTARFFKSRVFERNQTQKP